MGQGVVYEVMNMAALWKLPVIYVCENNMYNEYTHISGAAAGDILARGPAFGVPSESVDGQDVRAVYTVTKRLVERARRGEGPAFLQANTYRFMGHHVGDISREYYRSKQEEQEAWKTERDPIKVAAEAILSPEHRRPGRSGPDPIGSQSRDRERRAVRDDGAISERRQSGARRVCLKQQLPFAS